ncbi:uncharacterized protein LOC135501923 isoform X3 [Lineus longissimus]|uniref:uncharacterized protein LOC135501923 isoform X1 n=1 Tax=Lineus longissimus TaxID=88925 RepID=UPI00315D2778
MRCVIFCRCPAIGRCFSQTLYDINYFHCLRIVDLLKETEAGSKNMFGRSQRMKGNKIKSELLSLVKHLPAEFDKITTATRDLKEPVNLYEMFIEFTLKKF